MNQSSASRLLLVENDPKAVSLMRPVIEDLLPESAIFQVETLEAARHALSDATFACIVARAGAGLLAELLDHPQSAPIVCLTEPTAVGLHLLRRGIRDALELQTVRRRHEESELRGAAKRVPDVGHFELDADFTPVFVNELCHELTGLTQGDGDSFRRSLASVHPDDLPAVYAAIDELGAGRHVHTEHRRLRPGGSETTTNDVRIAPVVGADGRVVGYVGDVVDVTERRRVEARERSSRAQLQAIFDNSPSAMWFKDNDSRYVFANNLFGEYFQSRSADFDTMRDEDLWPADVAATVRSRDAAVIASGQPIEFEDEFDTPEGPQRFASVLFPVFDADGQPMGVCGVANDVTERHESAERFRRSFDEAPVAMTMSRPNGTWIDVNRAMADLLGYERSELLDRSYSEFTHPDDTDEDRRRVRDLVENGGTLTREKRLIRRDGSEIWVLSCVNIARDQSGRPLWALTHVIDITQRKTAEHELQRQQVDMLTIARVARDAGTSERPGQQVCQAAGQITGASAVGLLELHGTDRLVLAAAMEDNAPLGVELRITDPPTGSGLCAVSKERLFLSDARHAITQRIAPDAEMASMLFEPILRGTEVLGVLTIAWAKRREGLTPRESSVIRLLAAEMATTLERARLTSQLRELARTDPLTGLPNRRVWDERIAVEFTHAARLGNPVCVALLDLDHFKPYNDTHGHQAGDRLLTGATAAWNAELRAGDLLARVGGDEFAVLLPDCDLDDGRVLVERLRVATPNGVGCSVGIVQWDGHEPPDVAVARADAALYAAKESGRARSVVA